MNCSRRFFVYIAGADPTLYLKQNEKEEKKRKREKKEKRKKRRKKKRPRDRHEPSRLHLRRLKSQHHKKSWSHFPTHLSSPTMATA